MLKSDDDLCAYEIAFSYRFLLSINGRPHRPGRCGQGGEIAHSIHMIRVLRLTKILKITLAALKHNYRPICSRFNYFSLAKMAQPEGQGVKKQYSFIIQENAAGGESESPTLLRRSRRMLGDIDFGEASISATSGKCIILSVLQQFLYPSSGCISCG